MALRASRIFSIAVWFSLNQLPYLFFGASASIASVADCCRACAIVYLFTLAATSRLLKFSNTEFIVLVFLVLVGVVSDSILATAFWSIPSVLRMPLICEAIFLIVMLFAFVFSMSAMFLGCAFVGDQSKYAGNVCG